jgi:hypothetical protein
MLHPPHNRTSDAVLLGKRRERERERERERATCVPGPSNILLLHVKFVMD